MVEYLLHSLPETMIPAYFIKLPQFPLTANGKIDRKKLPEPEWNLKIGLEYVPPRTPTEKILAEIWKSELGLEKVGIKDNFFLIGGDSIKTIKLTIAINKELNKQISPDEFYNYNTIEKLALLVQQKESPPAEDTHGETLSGLDALKTRIIKGN
jgi:acyl carrier protein